MEFDQTRVGLLGIDSPERGQVCTRGLQRYDTESRAQLANLIAGRGVQCDHAGWDQKWSRPLARCWVGTLDLNAEMVRHPKLSKEFRNAGRYAGWRRRWDDCAVPINRDVL